MSEGFLHFTVHPLTTVTVADDRALRAFWHDYRKTTLPLYIRWIYVEKPLTNAQLGRLSKELRGKVRDAALEVRDLAA